MQFMVQIDVMFPATMTAEEKGAVARAETERAIELFQSGNLLRNFRVAGKASSFSLWSFDTLEAMDAGIKSLPAFPYFSNVSITPVIEHPSSKAYKDRHGALPPL